MALVSLAVGAPNTVEERARAQRLGVDRNIMILSVPRCKEVIMILMMKDGVENAQFNVTKPDEPVFMYHRESIVRAHQTVLSFSWRRLSS